MTEQAEQRPAPWVPMSLRDEPERREEFLALREGVPAGAQRMLVEWCVEQFEGFDRSDYVARLKQFEIASNQRIGDALYSSSHYLADALRAHDEALLDAIEFALQWASEWHRSALADILRAGRSIYRIGQGEGGRWELQKTHSDELVEMVEATAGRSGRAAEHLRIAWSSIAGRQPDPEKACWEAAKAVEVAAKRVIAPDDDTATLGKMRGEIKANPGRWEIDLAPAESIGRLIAMMSVVWEEGRRHGDEKKLIGVAPEAAEIVVQTAVVLVNWFESGFVRRASK